LDEADVAPGSDEVGENDQWFGFRLAHGLSICPASAPSNAIMTRAPLARCNSLRGALRLHRRWDGRCRLAKDGPGDEKPRQARPPPPRTEQAQIRQQAGERQAHTVEGPVDPPWPRPLPCAAD